MTDPSSTPLVRAVHLSRRATDSKQPLLNNIDLDLFAGQRIALVGPTGCGKSTLLRAIAMLDPGTEGEVFFRGTPVQPVDVPAYRRQVIYLPQRPAMAVGTVRKNLRLPFEMGVAMPPGVPLASEILGRLGKNDSFSDQEIDSLSGGERQIVALVRALQLDPVALLLDEPTASLDSEAVAAVEQIITSWYDEQPDRAYLWVSHDRDQVARVTDITLVMSAGTISVD